MVGGLIQIVTYGAEDIFLTGTPEITFFKMVYRRYTNFAIESVQQYFEGIIDFNNEVISTIEKNGDLMGRTFIEVVIPHVHLFKKDLNSNIALDEIQIELKERYMRRTETIYHTFKLWLDYFAFIYRILLLDINADLTGFFIDIPVSETIFNILNRNYRVFFDLTSEEIEVLNSGTNGTLPYLFIVNMILKYYNFKNNIKIAEVLFSDLNLRILLNNFFNKEEQNPLELEILLEEWYIRSHYALIFYEREYSISVREFEEVKNPFVKFAWIKRIGHFIAECIEVRIGGKKIDRQYGDWMNIWYEVSNNFWQRENYRKMIGDIKILTDFNNLEKPRYRLFIPLQFWFCKHNGLALPLVALRYYDVQIYVRFSRLEELAYIERGYNLLKLLHIESASLWVDYIYLDDDERRRFAKSSHEYLIEQVQTERFADVFLNKYIAKLNFVHPCKEFIWTLQANRFRLNPFDDNRLLDRTNYSLTKFGRGNPILESKIEFNTHTRVPKLDGNYYNYVQPYEVHSNSPCDGINLFSYAFEPEAQQPSGAANLSRISLVVIKMNIDERIYDVPLLEEYLKGAILTVYATNYNVLRIMSGMAGVAFSP